MLIPASLAAAVVAGWLATDPTLAAGQSVEPIKNGTDADTCQFPATVALLRADGTSYCSGSLIHPEIVLYASHCNKETFPRIGFGENVEALVRTVPVESCHRAPGSADVAFCRLAQPVTDVPIVPVMVGCEVEQMRVGDIVTVVGFGATDASTDGVDWTDLVGVGVKRYTTQTIEKIEPAKNSLTLLGYGSSPCPGDSGGPMLVELADGSWRVAGVASKIHPDAYEKTGEPCGYGSVYDMVYTQLEWLESVSGVDVTACHTPDGTYAPEPGCGPFPRSPGAIGLTWSNACATQDVIHAALCGEEQPPVVALLSPSDDIDAPDLDEIEVEILVDAHDDLSGVAAVWLRIDGQDLSPARQNPPYEFSVTLPTGLHTIKAVARDHAGNEGKSQALVVSVGAVEDGNTDADTGSDADDGEPPSESEDDEDADALPPVYGDDVSTNNGCGCATSGPVDAALLLLLGVPLIRRRR